MNIGRLKVIFNRQRNYITMFNFLMISYLFFKDVGFHWWYMLVIPFWIIFIKVDDKKIMPKENEYTWRNNPAYIELLDLVKKIWEKK